ncbi:MAG: hypothetical protein JNK40_13035 [Chromatiales bacterium]|nr:hypothetical protein [Chromatiales bacterium]
MATRSSGRSAAILAVAGGYGVQAGLLGLAFAATRAGGDLGSSLESSGSRLLAGGALALAVTSIALLVLARRRAAAARREQFDLPLSMALVSGLLCFLVIEAGLRVIAQPDALGQRIGATVLLPYEWPAVAQANRELLAGSRPDSDFYVADPRLGWTIGPARTSEDGLYASGAEGLRSREPGLVEAAVRAGPRIALFGDSFAFSEEVAFPDSLARYLEEELGNGAQLLNFGVPGFGIDQAALRFQYEGARWAPRVAVLAFIEDDLLRTANVYTFLKGSWGLPLSKPRYVLRDGRLELVNSPTLAGEALFGRSSVFDLPYLDYEIEFVAERWRRHPLHASYLLRLLNGMFPGWPARGSLVSDDAIVALSTRIIQDFRNSALANGMAPVIVYFPTSGDLNPAGKRPIKNRVLASLAVDGVAATDLTPCFAAGSQAAEPFMPGGHYTGSGNQAMAGCLAPLIRTALESTGADNGAAAEPPP